MTLVTARPSSDLVPDDWFELLETDALVPDKDEPFSPPATQAGDLGTLGESPEGEKLQAFMRSR